MATSNNSGIMAKRQSFNGRALTFVEVIFDVDITATATTPESKDSTFDKVSKVVNKNGNLLAQSYRLGAKATVNDAAEAAAINANDSIDSYQFIVEGTPGQYNAADSAGDVNMDIDATVLAAAEADLEADILAAIDVGDSAENVHVKMRTLLPEGHVNGDANSFVGMFDQRGDA
jgi:hypothetical protein